MTSETTWRKKYYEVLNSPRWKKLRKKIILQKKKKCDHCKQFRLSGLQLHHRTYERLGAELDEDLELLCKICHAKADIDRAMRGRARSAEALADARLEGWAAAKYGDEWYKIIHADEVEDEFNEWLYYNDADDGP